MRWELAVWTKSAQIWPNSIKIRGGPSQTQTPEDTSPNVLNFMSDVPDLNPAAANAPPKGLGEASSISHHLNGKPRVGMGAELEPSGVSGGNCL